MRPLAAVRARLDKVNINTITVQVHMSTLQETNTNILFGKTYLDSVLVTALSAAQPRAPSNGRWTLTHKSCAVLMAVC